MKRPAINAFGLLICAAILLWFLSISQNLISAEEVAMITLPTAVFMGLYFGRFRWAKWIAIVFLVMKMLLAATFIFEGFGFSFLIVVALYSGILVIVLEKQGPEANKASDEKQSNTNDAVADARPELPPVLNGFYFRNQPFYYPLLLKRYQSFFIDAMLLLFIMVVVMVIMGDSEYRQPVMITLGVVFTLLYEPLLTTYSATIGQRLMGIRVRDIKNPNERISLLQAYIRIVVKWLFGWLSFLSINFNPEHRAIHDFAGSSVVIKTS